MVGAEEISSDSVIIAAMEHLTTANFTVISVESCLFVVGAFDIAFRNNGINWIIFSGDGICEDILFIDNCEVASHRRAPAGKPVAVRAAA